MSLRLVSGGLWEEIHALASSGSRNVAAVAYVTGGAEALFNNGDLLVVDASDEAIKTGATSATVLKALHEREVELYSLPGLHAKVMVFGKTAIIGSANLTANSKKLVEAAVVTDIPTMVASAVLLIESLRIHSKAHRVTDAFTKRALALPVDKRASIGGGKTTAPILRPPVTWLVGIHHLDEDRYAHEAAAAESGMEKAAAAAGVSVEDLTWVRYPRSTRLAKGANVGDVLVQAWRSDEEDKHPDYVYRGTPILRRQEEPKCVRFYVREQGDDERVAWKHFVKRWTAAGLKKAPGRNTERVIATATAIALDSLWS